MQGRLNEIDVRSILQLLELGQRTGVLVIESREGRSWFVFFVGGCVVYAVESEMELHRLQDYLRFYKTDHLVDLTRTATGRVPALATDTPLEYGYLWFLLEKRLVTTAQARTLIQSMVQEVLFVLLELHQGMFYFVTTPPLSPQLLTLEVTPLLRVLSTQIQTWCQFYPHVQSPEQQLTIANLQQVGAHLPMSWPPLLNHSITADYISLIQLARRLGQDVVTVVKLLYPLIQQGVLQLLWRPISRAESRLVANKVPRVICIDDGVTVRKAVEGILSQHGYEVSAITNPLKALGLLFQLKPDLILCDIAMPELNGYDLCAMLKSSTVFRYTPVVMLTAQEQFVDRLKAHVAGAAHYLTKPFTDAELLLVVEQFVGPGQPEHPHPEKLLDQALADEFTPDADLEQPVPPV